MDYKKAYEDALERANGIYNENPSSSTAKFVCGQIFPEIKESEDERIRKELINQFSLISEMWFKNIFNGQFTKEQIIAYLEKQKAQRPAEWSDAERKKLYSDGYYSSRSNLALDFMHYIDEHRPEGKMCLSNGECAQLDNAFKNGDVETIVGYIHKYQQPAQVADASKMEQPESGGSEKPNYQQPEVDLEKFTEKIKTFQGRYKHPENISVKGAMAFMARMFYQYPNTARQWYDSLPKATMNDARKEK